MNDHTNAERQRRWRKRRQNELAALRNAISDNADSLTDNEKIPGADLDAEQSGADPLSALDVVAGKIERRLRKRKTERLARLPQNDREFTWAVAGGRWAVLRKHKGYGRGGPELELYDLVGGAK